MSESPRRSRRSWSIEFKRRVVAEASAPGVSVSAVARRYDLNANQIFNWRRRYGGAGAFLPVTILGSERPLLADRNESAPESAAGEIEIALATGHRVRLRGGFDPDLVARLLRGLLS